MTNRKKKGSGSSAGDAHRATSRDPSAPGEPAEPGSSSTRGGQSRRGFGDDQGTRIGSPTPGAPRHAGPSTRPVDQGLEGSILDEDETGDSSDGEQSDRADERERGR